MRALIGFGAVVATAASSAPVHADNLVGASFDVGAGMHSFDGVTSPVMLARFAITFPFGTYLSFTSEVGRVWADAPETGDGEKRDYMKSTTLAFGLRRSMGVVSFAGDVGLRNHVFYADKMDLRAQASTLQNSLALTGRIDVWLIQFATVGLQIGAAVAGDREQMFALGVGLHFGSKDKHSAVFVLPWEQRSAARDLR